MQRRVRLAQVLLIALAAASAPACKSDSYQSVPRPADAGLSPAEDNCRLYLARSGQFYGKVRRVEVIDSGTPIGSIGEGGYLCWDRKPGRGLIQILYHGPELDLGVVEGLIDFEGEPGGVYYYAVHLRERDRKPEMKLLDAAAGETLISERSPAELQ